MSLAGSQAECPAGRAFFLFRQKEAKRRFKRNRMVSLKDLFLLTFMHSETQRMSSASAGGWECSAKSTAHSIAPTAQERVRQKAT